MRGGGPEHRVSSYGCAGDDQGDVPSAAEACSAFVEDDEDCGVFGVEQRRDEVVEPSCHRLRPSSRACRGRGRG